MLLAIFCLIPSFNLGHRSANRAGSFCFDFENALNVNFLSAQLNHKPFFFFLFVPSENETNIRNRGRDIPSNIINSLNKKKHKANMCYFKLTRNSLADILNRSSRSM